MDGVAEFILIVLYILIIVWTFVFSVLATIVLIKANKALKVWLAKNRDDNDNM